MNTHNLGLLDTFVSIINEEEGTVDFSITEYLIQNIHHIESITINEIMDEAYVSRSSIRRYAHRLGYGSFTLLKENITNIIFPSNIHLRSFHGTEVYKEKLKIGLDSLFEDMNEVINYELIEEIGKDIYEHQRIVILSASNTTANMLKFQQELFYANKIVKLINSNQLKDYKKVYKNDETLFIVISVSGVFAKEIQEDMQHVISKKYLLTVNRKRSLAKDFTKTIYLSGEDKREDVDGLMSKYGVTYFFDLLSEHYIYNYMELKK